VPPAKTTKPSATPRSKDPSPSGTSKGSANAAKPSRSNGSITHAYVYDADGCDCEIDVGREGLPELGNQALLWIEIVGGDDVGLEAAAELLELPDDLLRRLRSDELRPSLADYEQFLHVRVVEIADEKLVPVAVDAVAGENWLLTFHGSDGGHSERFQAAFRGETELGRLDSLSLLAALLECHVGAYFAAIATVEEQIEDFDEEVMRARVPDGEKELSRLVALRRKLALLRRHLVLHRDPFSTLGDPDLTSLATEDSAKRFRGLQSRLERAVDGAESARQLVAGSFEILMTRTGQRTNEIMKILTLVSAALLPSAVIAGVLGMNFEQSFFELSYLFWVVVALMAMLMVGVVVLARRRRWL
jgi:magnesium transporter